jgi:hypothetical protein
MIKNIISCLLIAISVSACSPGKDSEAQTINNDFDVFCEQFTLLTESAEFSQLSSEDRASRLDTKLSGALAPSANAYIAWTAIRNGPPSERYFLYKDAASSAGHNHWECPAVKQHGHEVGSPHR